MQESQATVVEADVEAEIEPSAATVDDLGLEVVETVSQIGLFRPIRHIRAPQ